MSITKPKVSYFFFIFVLIGFSFVKASAQSSNPVVPLGHFGDFHHGTYPSLPGKTHAGIDIGAAAGSNIYAFADGIVVDLIDSDTDRNFNSLGYMVMIKHSNVLNAKTFYTIYLHMLNPPLVELEKAVVGGKTIIGKVGKTGAAHNTYHTHFEIRYFASRFFLHKNWNNIYGDGDRSKSSEFVENWENPEEFFKKYPQGMSQNSPSQQPTSPIPSPPISKIPTLFLFDVSGSMNENGKIGQARDAGLDALREMRENADAPSPVSIMTFSGDNCGGRVTQKILNFTGNLVDAENTMRLRLPVPDGGTPLPQAKDAAYGDLLSYLNTSSDFREGRIILLSDGQSTCGSIRPPDVYSIKRTDMLVSRASSSRIRYLTVGFDVPAGSEAERDLQYLASISGGKYYNAANRSQLIRAFQKQVRRFIPRPCNPNNADFAAGLRAFADLDYPVALDAFRRYSAANPNDWCGTYNLALAYEAHDRYKKAADTYQLYLKNAPNSPDRAKIEQRIAQLRQDYLDQLDYYINLMQSDVDYLKRYYQSIFNRSSADLGQEFSGFAYEKRDFYAILPDLLEIDARWLINDSKDISSSIDVLTKRKGIATFDRDAVSLLSIPISLIEDTTARLRSFRAR